MVKFGADEIMKTGGTGISDEDIDILLQKGEAKTEEQKNKFQSDVQHNLANFTLGGDEQINLFEFDGERYNKDGTKKATAAESSGIHIALPQRERKRNYDVNGYFRDALRVGDKPVNLGRKNKVLKYKEFQFFDIAALNKINDKENELYELRLEKVNELKEAREEYRRTSMLERDVDAFNARCTALEEEIDSFHLDPKMLKEKEKLQAQGFGHWSTRDFRSFCNAMEENGRKAKNAIFRDVSNETGKTEGEVETYYNTFWKKYKDISDWQKIISKIEAGEYRIARAIEIKEALEAKVKRHTNPWQTMTIEYGGAANKGKEFSDEEDVFLVNMMHIYGYGNWEKIRMQIRKSHRFAFDWFFKSRTSSHLEKRGNTLIKLIERENEEVDGVKKGKGKKRDRETEEIVGSGKKPKKGKSKKK